MLNGHYKYNLPDFINLIKSLELSGHIHQHAIHSTKDNQYLQLPFEVSSSFDRFDYFINDSELKNSNPTKELNAFLRTLAKSACLNYNSRATTETEQADFLLSFLMHHPFELEVNNQTVALKDLIMAQMESFRHTVEFEGKAYSVFNCHFEYDFLIKEKRDLMNLPDLKTISANWNAYCQKQYEAKIAIEKAQTAKKEKEAKIQKEREQLIAQQRAYVAAHRFDGIALSLEKLIYALEGFVKMGKVQLANNQFTWPGSNALSPELTMLINRFAQLVRPQPFTYTPFGEDAKAFTQFMKVLINSAKYANPHQTAAQQLLGFMLYHNFEIKFQNQTFTIADIVKAEMVPHDYQGLSQFGPSIMPFLDQNWLSQQNFPGRNDLEKVINNEIQLQAQANQNAQTFAPMFVSVTQPIPQPAPFAQFQPQPTPLFPPRNNGGQVVAQRSVPQGHQRQGATPVNQGVTFPQHTGFTWTPRAGALWGGQTGFFGQTSGFNQRAPSSRAPSPEPLTHRSTQFSPRSPLSFAHKRSK